MSAQDPEVTGVYRPPTEVSAGTVLQRRYRLLERLGVGGMGEAWKAANSGRLVDGQPAQVVIKLLPPELRRNDEANEDIRREYSRVWLLSHPHICKLFDMGEEDGIGCFQVMQYLPGITLRQWMRRHSEGISASAIVSVLSAAASALDYAHGVRKPVVHRDVKPENIMLDPQTGDVHVIDFGLAAEIRNSQTRLSGAETVIAGTASYMSPEQWQGRPASAACDQWALGIVAWELLTGTRPFQGNGMALGFAVCQAALPVLPEPYAFLQDLFARVLCKEPAGRFRTCGDFVSQMQFLLQGTSTDATLIGAQAAVTPSRSIRPEILIAPFSAETARMAQTAWARYLGCEVHWRDEFGQDLRLIPPGEYVMGSDETAEQLQLAGFVLPHSGWREWIAAESPGHTVRITRPFYLGVSSATRAHFAAFVRATGYRTDAEAIGKGGWGYAIETKNGVQRSDFNWKQTGFAQSEQDPVVNVTWKDAQAYLKWLNELTAESGSTVRYRLPREAEWEYACRAGTTSRFFTGDQTGSLRGFANVQDVSFGVVFPSHDQKKWQGFSFDDGAPFTSSAGLYSSNPFGLCDMLGNVWDWCNDYFDAGYFGRSPVEDPRGPSSGDSHVLRGGSWASGPVHLRCSSRDYYGPGHRSYAVGFRVVADLTQAEKV